MWGRLEKVEKAFSAGEGDTGCVPKFAGSCVRDAVDSNAEMFYSVYRLRNTKLLAA